ncbi:N-acetylmuramoyl-L-alanine amidase [Hymenobacter daecheongensis DSM 21074]|uniref:N-acetylmuramoyl-L-alanine amidase n=1 Tax=Hymenobacter daecheongensis DSM 21074 TaxID=1121955 RepID=A0A1M6EIX9_9BACT|nr:peptidoglycan recognition family protein [Hymenobacter daecheongensis]SHI85376.1 N-acetylmuramoyl-L-alanine amidase [Hymenobacter daecheongensis DSM 21074]
MTTEAAENEIKLTELAIKKAELKAKETELTKAHRFSITTSIPLLIALVGLAASAITAVVQKSTSIELERNRFRSSLLLKALDAQGTENISKTLLFMVDTKILEDKDGSIRRAANKPEELPTERDTTARIKFGTPKTPRVIDKIVVSDTGIETDYARLLAAMKQPAIMASYHYLVDMDGHVHSMVADSLIAYHAGKSEVNAHSLGIGVMHIPDNSQGYSRNQIASLKQLIHQLSTKYRIKPANVNGKNHYNPSRRCDFDLIRAEVLASGGTPHPR